MKNLNTAVMLLLFITVQNLAFAQKSETSKKEIFTNFPSKISIPETLLCNTLNAKSGESVTILLDSNITIKGSVISNEQVFENLQTIIIKLQSNNNALFQLSKIINKDHTESYVGRIVDMNASDAFVIAKSDANEYQLEKIELNSILQDCSL